MESTIEEIRDKARELLQGTPEFADDTSQFIEELCAIHAVGVHKSHWESHSDRNEYYTDTAQLDSSHMAKASDEGKIPDRPLPQIVKCEVTSEGTESFDTDSITLSDLGTEYRFDGSYTVNGNTIEANLVQVKKTEYAYTPTTEDWQDFIVGNSKTSSFEFYVGGVLWEDIEKIGELPADGEGYITRYNILGELYARTGNTFLGKIPVGQIDVVSYDTESTDIQVDAPLYAQGASVAVEIKVIEIVQASREQESALSVSKGLQFWRLKSGGSGYASDYIDDIFGEFPEALSVRAWGERRESDSYDRDNINIIFVSALRETNQGTFGVEILAFLNSKANVLQVEYEWREPTLVETDITITGKIDRIKTISVAETDLGDMIEKYYGLYAEKADRRRRIFNSFLNKAIEATGVFENLLPSKNRDDEPEYEFSISGSRVPSGEREIIHIPSANVTINLEHVSNA